MKSQSHRDYSLGNVRTSKSFGGVRVVQQEELTELNPRHACLKPALKREVMKHQLRDHSVGPRVYRPFNSINVEKHERGIKRHSSVDNTQEYQAKRTLNKKLR